MVKKGGNIKNQIQTNLWLYGYSIDYLTSLGQPIDLYTDSFGATIFNCLPYRNINTSLDELNETSERFWSAGKLVALRNSPLGTVHIDGDVFLKKQQVLDALSMQEHDCICQMEERLSIFRECYETILPMFRYVLEDTIDGFDYTITRSLNAGVIGFKNQELKDSYIRGYFEILNKCQGNENFMEILKQDITKEIEPNLVIEQYFLKSFCEVKGYAIKNLLQLSSDDFTTDLDDMNIQANELGYAHAWGSSKYRIIPQIQEILKERSPELFQAITNKIASIQ